MTFGLVDVGYSSQAVKLIFFAPFYRTQKLSTFSEHLYSSEKATATIVLQRKNDSDICL